MQELCQLCELTEGSHKHWLFGLICPRCHDQIKWNHWHEGIRESPALPVREKE